MNLERILNGKYKRLVAEVSLGEVNKPTTQNTRDVNDFVHSERLARKKPLLAGYKTIIAMSPCRIKDYFFTRMFKVFEIALVAACKFHEIVLF